MRTAVQGTRRQTGVSGLAPPRKSMNSPVDFHVVPVLLGGLPL
jgi:hypothetical protein